MRRVVISIVSVPVLQAALLAQISNPYEKVDWEHVEYWHSFSHQHISERQLEPMRRMGYRHLPISNYYPSKPSYPLPEAFSRKYPDILGAPNAEQHSATDAGIHFNAIGSWYATGYGGSASPRSKHSPFEHEFENVCCFDPDNRPWQGIYRLDLAVDAVGAEGADPMARVTVEGALSSKLDYHPANPANTITDRVWGRKSAKSIVLKATGDSIKVRIKYDPDTTKIALLRLMQGVYRPWRDAFRAALDGEARDGEGHPIEGLIFPDGGGITINHPSISAERIMEMLDFDQRVLGIEAWNQRRWFGGTTLEKGYEMSFYTTWDKVLRSGRRCYGFFVKDHRIYGRGRNILLVPPQSGNSREEQEHTALKAYRNGSFFGLLGAMTLSPQGKPVNPYDYSEFRFLRLSTRREAGEDTGIEVLVGGANQQQRPNTQIRFITEQGVAHVVDGPKAYFPFPRNSNGEIVGVYVRVEAFAYPDTHLGGKPLSPAEITGMTPFEIARLHNVSIANMPTEIYPGAEAPQGIVDMIFSQPIMLKKP